MILLVALSLGVAVLDQLSKYLVSHTMALGQSIYIIPRVLSLTYVRNTGAAFGLMSSRTALLALVSAGVIVAAVVLRRQLALAPWLTRIGASLALGGAMGNLIDRVRLGGVVDFLYLRYCPVINIADSAIVVGVGLIALAMFREGGRTGPSPAPEPGAEAGPR